MDESVSQPLMLKKKSRSSRFSSWTGEANTFRDKIFRGLYIFLLFSLDFVMFIYSINGRLAESGHVNPAITLILCSILGLSIVAILVLSFSKNLQNLLCAVCTVLVTVMFFYQFGEGDVDNFLENWFNENASWLSVICIVPSPWIVGLLLGIAIFFLFQFSDAILFVVLVLLLSVVIGVQKNEFLARSDSEYQEILRSGGTPEQGKEDNIVYFMISHLPSYQLFNSVQNPYFKELSDLMIAFYAVNNFEVYPNAFVQKDDTMSNIIDIMNQVDYTSSTSGNRGFAQFIYAWNFIHGGQDVLSLEDNQLYEYLNRSGYGVSMYAMPGFDFCLKNGSLFTDRCVVKDYKTVSLYDEKSSKESNVYALLGEWIMSLKSRDFNSFAKMLINMSPLKNMKVLSENRRVSIEGAAEVFDKLNDNIRRDTGGQVYLVYVDLPSDIYIYDEFCNIKPRKDWVALKDNSLFSGGIDEKRKAYVEQTKCLIGKLQEYIDEMRGSHKLENTDIFIQGVSTIRELAGMVSDYKERFVVERLVNLGVRRGQKPKFLINANICLASDFTKTIIRYQDFCYSLEDIRQIKGDDARDLRRGLLQSSIIRSSRISSIVGNYRDWYELYKTNSQSYQEKISRKQKDQEERLKIEKDRLIKDRVEPVVREEDSPVHRAQYEENIFVPTDDVIPERGAMQKSLKSEESAGNDKEGVAKSDEAALKEEAIPEIDKGKLPIEETSSPQESLKESENTAPENTEIAESQAVIESAKETMKENVEAVAETVKEEAEAVAEKVDDKTDVSETSKVDEDVVKGEAEASALNSDDEFDLFSE